MTTLAAPSLLEDFVRDYVETLGGAWDEVEPQVYDLLLPAARPDSLLDAASSSVTRIAFDPEAIPEHPGAQLASFGTPFIDGLLQDALGRGRSGQFFLIGLNVFPHDLPARARRAVTISAPAEFRIERVRPLHFAQAVFWFQAEFVSDRKEQQIVPVAMDLHYGREVRHLDALMDRARLAEQPALPLPEARRLSLPAVYPRARDQVLRTFAAQANTRGRELGERCDLQVARMARYYADLRAELEGPGRRTKDDAAAAERLAARRQAIDREEQLRISELRHKSALRVQLRLLQLLIVQQPKLLLHARAVAPERPPVAFEMVWDPLMECLEAVPCASCQRPTFTLTLERPGCLVCSACGTKADKKKASK